MNREDIREKIDAIDDQLCDLFSKRMDLALSMAKYKKENGLAVLDSVCIPPPYAHLRL